MKNVKELREDLVKMYQELVAGDVPITEARARTNAARTILKSAALEMEHNKFIGNRNPVTFLNPND